MRRILTILIALVAFSSCDPIYVGELRNFTEDEIEVKVCGENLSYVNYDNSGREIATIENTKNCKTIKVGKGEAIPLASASEIASPITYQDLGFEELEITTNDGQIQATGKAIMSLFDIEKQTNFIGIHTSDLYQITIGQRKEE